MDFKLDQNSPVPLYAQIEKYLRELIVKDKYKNGDKLLPNEVALSKKLGVSRNTVRQAINELVRDGLIERKKGVGTKILSRKISTRGDKWISFTNEMKNQGIKVVDYLVKVSLANPEEEEKIYSILSVPKTKQIWKLEKIRGSEKAKYLYSVSYFHPRVGIKGDENFATPLYELLEKEHDIVVSTSKEQMRAINADHNIASILDINKGTAILKRERLVSDIGNRQIEYNIVYYCTDYFSYDIDIKREF